MRKTVAALGVLLMCACARTSEAPPAVHVMVSPENLQWKPMPNLPPGAMVAVIEGPIDQPRPFMIRLKLPSNYEIPAHLHPWIEHVTVLSGTLHMGLGDKLDRTRTNPLPVGGAAVIPGNANHFSWTAEETVVQVHGIGPLVITYVNPADDPRKK